MASIREQIITALKTALDASGGIGCTGYRSRATPLARQEFPAYVVEPISDVALDSTNTKADRLLTLRLAILVKSEIPDQAADPYMVLAHRKIMAAPSLGGLAMDITPGDVNWDLIEADVTTGIVTANFGVLYRFDQSDIELP